MTRDRLRTQMSQLIRPAQVPLVDGGADILACRQLYPYTSIRVRRSCMKDAIT